MSDGMIVFLSILAFILIAKAIDAFSESSGSRRKRTAMQQTLSAQLVDLGTALQDIRQRLTSIEQVLEQVE